MDEDQGGGSHKWLAATVGAQLPAAALSAGGAAFVAQGSFGLGAGLLGAGVALAVVHHLLVQPRLDNAHRPPAGDLVTAALGFARRAVKLRRIEEVGALLGSTIHQSLGLARTLLLVPEAGSETARILGDTTAVVPEADGAYVYLATHPYPVTRGDPDPQATPVRELCDALDVDVALGLRHRGALLGILLAGRGQQPVGERELDFLHRLGLQATVAIANTHLFDEARGRAKLSREVDLATAVQEDLLPPESVLRSGTVVVRGLSRPAAECGGDFWFWRQLGDDRALLVIGDVTGHGLPAAVVAATAKGCCEACVARAGADGLPAPVDVLEALNRAVFHAGRSRYHMTCFVAILDGRAHTVRFANAGHNFPYLVTDGSGDRAQLANLIARGNTLGQTETVRYAEATRPFATGDRIVFYTDGVVEALSELGHPLGEKRFRRLLVDLAKIPHEELADHLYAEVGLHMGARPAADDITIVTATLETAGREALS